MKKNKKTVLLIAMAFSAVAFLILNEPRLEEAAQTGLVSVPAPQPEVQPDEFAIAAPSLRRIEHRVKRGETFSDILSHYRISAAKIHEVVERSSDALDVRKIRPGERLFVYRSDTAAVHLVYQPDAVQYVAVSLADPVQVRTGARPVHVTRKTVRGTIEGSLYSTMLREGGDPTLVDRIANEIYAWTIDFQHLQKGDRFSVIYEEKSVDGVFFGIGEILAVRLDHAGAPHYAYRFEQDGRSEYFDEDGNSLRKALLKSPLRFSAVTSGYTKRRFHPVQKRYKPHLGTDYAAPTGTPIWSVGDGAVVEAQFKSNNGNYVKIRHNGTYTTGYLHMSRIARGVKPGSRVTQGQIIGYVGSTGLATGPHVCYRFWKNGTQVDSRKEVMPPSDPILPEYREAFALAMRQIQPQLDGSTPDVQLAIENDSPDARN